MIGAYLVGFVNAVLALVLAFGINLTQTQVGAITAVVNAGILLVTAILHYRQLSKPSTAPVVAQSRSTIQ